MHRRAADGTLTAHGILVLEVSGDAISGFDAFADPALVPLFERPRQ